MILGVLAAIAIACGGGSDDSPPRQATREGACEPSAALVDPRDASRVLVADDERRRVLHVYAARGGTLVPDGTIPIPSVGAGHAEDVEAMAWHAEERVLWLVGSHSRSSDGRPDAERARLRGYRFEGDELVPARILDTPNLAARGACLHAFAPVGEPETRAICEAIEREGGLNVEGAVVAAIGGGGARLWLGLRAPLLDGAALLVRVGQRCERARDPDSARTPSPPTCFDAIARIDLGGQGVRELYAPDAESLLIIGGATRDGGEPSTIYRASLSSARDLVAAAAIAHVDPRAEALATWESRTFVFLDAGQADCLESAPVVDVDLRAAP